MHIRAGAQAPGEHRRRERLQVGLPGQRGVQRIEPPGRLEQQRRRVAPALARERDLGAQPLQPRALELVDRPELGGGQQVGRGRRVGDVEPGLGRGERARDAQAGIRGQLGGALQERRGRRQPAPGLRPAGRALQFAGCVLVGPVGRTSAVPRPAVRVQPRVGRVGEGPVDLASLGRGRGPVGGRTDQRMPEPHPRADLDQGGRLGRFRRGGPDAEPLGRAPQQRHVADRLGRRQYQQAPGRRRERHQLVHEALLDPAGQLHLHRQPEPARDRDRRPAARQLEQRERVAAGLAEDPVPHSRVERPGDRRVQQPAGVGRDQAPDHELGQPGKLMLVAGRAQREHQSDPLRQEAPRHERERLDRHPVKPLRVVDDADERLVLGHIGQQAEDGQADQEAIRRRAGAHAERDVQRVALRDR